MNNISTIYFIGIGGIGMSALARYFHRKGVKVSGYDRTSTPLTKQLMAEGIDIHFEENLELAPKKVDLVVYTPAVPLHHTELQYYINNGFPVKKRSEVLGMLTENQFAIAVAGTHGKTTVSSMITHILTESGYGCTAFVGGIMSNYNSNFVMHERAVVVVEADEFDRSFLRLFPDIAVITSADPDHLDIYGEKAELENAFIEFAGQLQEEGKLIVKCKLPITDRLKNKSISTYHLSDTSSKFYVKKIKIIKGSYSYQVNNFTENFVLHMGGLHNIENATAAAIVAKKLGIEEEKIVQALATFKGIKRRFQYILQTPEIVMIDDYAHHPVEVSSFLKSVRGLYPNKKMTVIFQPHLYSRTRDFADGFAESLSLADEVILLDIYPAREEPIEGVTSKIVFDKIKSNNKYLLEKKYVINFLKERDFELLLTVGAGNIDQLVLPISTLLSAKVKAQKLV